MQDNLVNVKYRIEVLDMKDCLNNPTIMGYFRGMTIHEFSGMNIMLNEFVKRKTPVSAKAIVAYTEDEPIAWGLYTNEPDSEESIAFEPDPGDVYLQVFVKPEYRGNGIGSTMYLKAQELAAGRQISVSKHSPEATTFFQKVQSIFKKRPFFGKGWTLTLPPKEKYYERIVRS